MKKYTFLLLAGVAPLLMGAGNIGEHSSKLSATSVPSCADSEYLIYRTAQGGLACEKLAGGAVNLPTCSNQILTSTSSGDVSALKCTDKGSATVSSSVLTAITALEDKLTKLGTMVTTIETQPASATSYYAGATTQTSNGKITDAAGNVGLAAAAALCAAQYNAGAHMCTAYEIYNSVAAGKITTATQIPQGWVYLTGWNTPVAGPTEPLMGLNDNCAGQTYPTGDQKWTGTTLNWQQVTFTGRFAPKFTGKVACSTILPIICCK